MLYLVGDDTGNGKKKYHVMYMIYEEGASYIRDVIDKSTTVISKVINGFERFHFRELLNTFKTNETNRFITKHGIISNSPTSVIEGVASLFTETYVQLVRTGCILPVIFVSKVDTWKEELDATILSCFSGIKRAEKLYPLLCIKKCINYLQEQGLEEEIACISDMVGSDEKNVRCNSYINGYKTIDICFQAAKDEPLLQMADFLAYSYNRLQTKGEDDIFNQLTVPISKYYQS